MTVDINKILDWLNSLSSASPITLTFFLCLASGWLMKRTPWLDNKLIPIRVAVIGAIALPMLSSFQESSIQSVRAFIASRVIIGIMNGAASSLAYSFILKPILKKFGGKDSLDSDPPFPKDDGSNIKKPEAGIPATVLPPTNENK